VSDAIRDVRGKAHRPRNPEGFAHQSDKSSAQTACGFVLRRIKIVPVEDVTDLCRICWRPKG